MEFTISDAAANKLFDVLNVAQGQALRVSIRGGGCAGFEYQFDVAEDTEEGDFIHSHQAHPQVRVLIDPVSAGYLDGAQLDYIAEKFDARFVLKNPHATTTCGCGQSFAA